MLEQYLKKLKFYKDVKFETKGKQLLVRSANRTVLQELTQNAFKKDKIKFKPRRKVTEVDVVGANQVLVFKPFKAKGTGGLDFEDQLKEDLQRLILPGIEISIESNWSGIMAFGKSKNPIVKKASENVFVAARLGGMGVAIGAGVADDLVGLLETQ